MTPSELSPEQQRALDRLHEIQDKIAALEEQGSDTDALQEEAVAIAEKCGFYDRVYLDEEEGASENEGADSSLHIPPLLQDHLP